MTTQPKLPLFLSTNQRDLLLKYQSQLTDRKIKKKIIDAHRNDDQYAINLTEEQIDDLYDNICLIANNENDIKQQSALDDFSDYFAEKYLDLGDDDNDIDEDDADNDESEK